MQALAGPRGTFDISAVQCAADICGSFEDNVADWLTSELPRSARIVTNDVKTRVNATHHLDAATDSFPNTLLAWLMCQSS